MRRPALFLLGLVVSVASAGAADSGRTAGGTLLRSVGARPSALGEAYTAVGGDIDALAINPAGLARLPAPTVSSTYLRGLADDNFGFLSYAHSLPFGAIFVGGSLYDAGTIDINQSDGTTGSRKAQQDMVGMVGFALGRNIPVSAGVTAKYLKSELAEIASANTVAVDAGAQWRTPVRNLTVGAAIQNVGSNLKYESQGDPLPETVRVGLSYLLDLQGLKVLKVFPYRFLVSVDGVNTKRDNSGVRTGLEITRDLIMGDYQGSASLRGGYRSDTQTGDVGLGFLIGNFSIDYSIHLISALDPSHHVTLAYRFAEKERRPYSRR